MLIVIAWSVLAVAVLTLGALLVITFSNDRFGIKLEGSQLRPLLLVIALFIAMAIVAAGLSEGLTLISRTSTTAPPVPPGVPTSVSRCVVKSFAEGDHRAPTGGLRSLEQEPRESAVDRIMEVLGREDLLFMAIVGHADARELRAQTAAVYGTNLTLAHLRAREASASLLREYGARDSGQNRRPEISGRVLVLASGSDHWGANRIAAELAEDRAVEIVAYSSPKAPTVTATTSGTIGTASVLNVANLEASVSLTFFTILVALSAYLASVRLVAIARLGELNDPETDKPEVRAERIRAQRAKIKRNLRWLTVADIPMVLAALLLGLHVFYFWPAWTLHGSFYLFTFAGLALLASHGFAWWRSITA